MENVVISNTYAACGYLISNYKHKYEDQHINIKNLTFTSKFL